jgi:hypothetical protein
VDEGLAAAFEDYSLERLDQFETDEHRVLTVHRLRAVGTSRKEEAGPSALNATLPV